MANINASEGNDSPVADRPGLVDRQIEDRNYRAAKLTDPEVGLFCLSIEGGDQLGEIYLNTQFEAKPGEHDRCQKGQNRVLLHNSGWLRELLEEIVADGVDVQVELVPNPCPKSSIPVAVDEAVRVLQGTRRVEEALTTTETKTETHTQVHHDHRHEVKN